MPAFLKRLLGLSTMPPLTPFLPDGQRVYAIGDVHGRLDLLQELFQQVKEDVAGYDGSSQLVLLGDYIDRGGQSKEVIDFLLSRPFTGFKTTFLMGNHEQTLLDFLRHPEAVASWLSYGGRATLDSYGVTQSMRVSQLDLIALRDELQARLPARHLEFYQSLSYFHVCGSYCFVHAGIRPGIGLQEQRNADLLWIREDFTASEDIHEHIVVHGHSITPQAEFRNNRIGIDTGAFHSGILTCLVLEQGQQRLIQTGGGASAT